MKYCSVKRWLRWHQAFFKKTNFIGYFSQSQILNCLMHFFGSGMGPWAQILWEGTIFDAKHDDLKIFPIFENFGKSRNKLWVPPICIRTYVWIWSRDIDNDVSVASDVSTSGSDSWLSRNDVIKCDVTIWNSTKINPKWQSQSNQKFNIYTELPITETKDLDNLRLHCILS